MRGREGTGTPSSPRATGRSLRASIALAAALVLAGCNDKASGDGGKTAVLAASLDAASDPSDGADAGSGLEDTAMPQSSGEELSLRMRHLLEAIAQNNPDLASDVLFPRDAYVAVRDSSDPQRAWEKRVESGFRRSVERMHKRMKGIERARFVSFEIGRSIVQVSPKRRDYKKPLWRVKHSKLTFTIDGKARHLDIAEMVAWRGAWYVTRLR